jgi:branched-subunit amino acid transport protein
MNVWLVVGVAAGLTYLSRVAALVFLPPARGGLASLIDRLPAPLFGALAAYSIVEADGGLVEWPVLVALAGALIGVRTRSLLVVLAAGIGAYAVALGIAAL